MGSDGWIPIEQGAPANHHKPVLVPGPFYSMPAFYDRDGMWTDLDGKVIPLPTHWMPMPENPMPRCCACGCRDDLVLGPDPFAEEIGGDDTPVWECDSCRQGSAREI